MIYRLAAEFPALQRLDLRRCVNLRNRHLESVFKSKVLLKEICIGAGLSRPAYSFGEYQLTNQVIH